MMFPSPLVTTEWLAAHLYDADVVILDASLPKPKAKPEDNPLHGRQIPSARFFDIEGDFSAHDTDLPHMMPTEAQFNEAARRLGINCTSKIVIYDNLGIYSAPRAWWMFLAMGHADVAVLDGGLPAWVNENRATEMSGEKKVRLGNFEGKYQRNFFRSADEVLSYIDDARLKVLDARSSGRFNGKEPEPRVGLRGGHIPNSLSLPFPEVLDGNHLLTKEKLLEKFQGLGIRDEQLTFSCGSGLTACILTLGAYVAGFRDLSVYDGSWSEWGQPGELPVIA
jgi:thiosulfate/3-mercaptopyruvate sulfurtransferase